MPLQNVFKTLKLLVLWHRHTFALFFFYLLPYDIDTVGNFKKTLKFNFKKIYLPVFPSIGRDLELANLLMCDLTFDALI